MKIEIRDRDREHFVTAVPPFDSVFTGSNESDPGLGIYIRQSALSDIDDYLSEDTSNELGGVLVGDICETPEGDAFVRIENMIIARHANSSLSRLTFTHETWEQINSELDKDFPGKRILGWFHSHPGHTVFFSGHDLFIQENFFNLPYMVAYVFDPTIKDRAFYKWSDDKVVKSGGFYIYDNIGGNQIRGILQDPDNSGLMSDTEGKSKFSGGGRIDLFKSIVLALSIFSIFACGFMLYKFAELNRKVEAIDELREEVKSLKENMEMTSTGQAGKNVTEGIQGQAPADWAGAQTKDLKSPMQQATDSSAKDAVQGKNPNDPSSAAVRKYTVQNGDTFEKISVAFYGSPAGIKRIMSHNNIKDIKSIKAGQVIEIPASEK